MGESHDEMLPEIWILRDWEASLRMTMDHVVILSIASQMRRIQKQSPMFARDLDSSGLGNVPQNDRVVLSP